MMAKKENDQMQELQWQKRQGNDEKRERTRVGLDEGWSYEERQWRTGVAFLGTDELMRNGSVVVVGFSKK